MKLDLMVMGASLRTIQQLARDASDAGFDGLVITESGRTAYLSCAAAALASDLDIAIGIAVAFPRSPMVTASAAWELAEATWLVWRRSLLMWAAAPDAAQATEAP